MSRRVAFSAVFGAHLIALLAYHGVQDTVSGFQGPPWTFGYEIGHVARSVALGQGFSYRIRGVHGTVPSVSLEPDLRRVFNELPIAGQEAGATTLPVSWASPAYTVLLAGIFRVLGPATPAAAYAAVGINCVLQATALLVLLSIALRLQAPGVAVLAAGLFFLEPSGFDYTGHMWSQSLQVLSVLLLLRVTLYPPGRLPDLGFGLCAALPLLVDSSSTPIVLLAFGFRAVRGARSGLRPQLVAGLVLGAALLPWTLRNGAAVGVYTPLKNTAGVVLRMGNAPRAAQMVYYNGLFANPFWNGDEMPEYARLGEKDYNRVSMTRALQFIAEDPARFGRAVRDRAVIFWLGRRGLEWVRDDLEEEGFKDLGPLDPGDRGRRLWRATLLVLLPFGLASGLRSRDRRPAFVLFALILVSFPIVYYLTIAIDRYRSPIDALLCLAAAQALAAGHSGFRSLGIVR